LRRRILYAISGHGYGHATRSLVIAAEVLRRYPDVRIVYSTSVPPEFLLRSGACRGGEEGPGGTDADREEIRCAAYEPGTSERTCFEVDPEATRAAYRRWSADLPARLDAEADHLRSGGYAGVISDIAALPIAAAARAGIPAVAVSNFTWDWILAPILGPDPALRALPGEIAAQYGSARTYLRLPLHPEPHPFREAIDLPLVGRRATAPAARVRELLGLPPAGSRPLVLLSIGGLRAGDWPRIRADAAGMDFVVVGPLPVEVPGSALRLLPESLDLRFEDLVGAADAVLGKPGYGICSECAANGTPLVAVERTGFAEYAALRAGMPAFVPFREMSRADFFAGRWRAALEEVLARGRPEPPPPTGAAEAAARIGTLLSL
jgi:hypothetical protein